jgi:outer membrane receptor protein involved in Fe transport
LSICRAARPFGAKESNMISGRSRRRWSSLKAFIAIAFLIMATGAAAQPAATGRVTGSVVDATSGEPMQYAALRLVAVDGGEPRAAVTGADGAFSFDGLPFGRYRLGYGMVGMSRQQTPVFTLDERHALQSLGQLKLNTAAAAVETVEVAGRRPTVQNLIDRKTYTIGRDLQSTTGSLSDVLKNLPSVEIDFEGNLSLRGDQSVLVLIDGKSSALLAGNRGDAMEQIPADSIDRIEVITNPSAQFRPDGSGGIINVITKKNAEPGYSGSLRLNAGSEGRYNMSATGGARFGKYNLSGSLSLRRDKRSREGTDERSRTDTAANLLDMSEQETSNDSRRLTRIAKIGADVDIDKRNRLGATVSYNYRTSDMESREHNVLRDATSAVTEDVERIGLGSGTRKDLQTSMKYVRAFADQGHDFTLEISRGEDRENWQRDYVNAYRFPATPDTFDLLRMKSSEIRTEVSADYVLPLADGSSFKAGYALDNDDNDYDNFGSFLDPSTGSWLVDPAFTNRFRFSQAVHAGYATYQTSFGKLGALAGLRLEQVTLTTNQVTTGQVDKTSYFRAYPTLHLSYDLSKTGQIKLSYSHRVNRPDDEDLNPYPEYHDALNLEAGNPHLLPEETDSFEAGYQYTEDKLNYLLTAYYRNSRDVITEVSRYINPTTLLTTKENLAKSMFAGLEFNANADVGSDLSFTLNGNAYYNEIDPGNLGGGTRKSGLAWSGKIGVDYQLTPKDLFQISANYSAKRLMPQGYRLPGFTANAGFRHDFDGNFSGILTVNDLFDSHKHKSYTETAVLHDVSVGRMRGRIIFVGLVYTFGGKNGGKTREDEDNSEDPG